MSSPGTNHLRILLNAASLSGILTGTARYARGLYDAILKLRLAEVGFFVNGNVYGEMPSQAGSLRGRYLPPQIRYSARMAKQALMEYRLNRVLNDFDANIYHETGMFPVSQNLAIPTILTIYDLSLLKYKQFHPVDRVRHFERHFFRRIAAVDHIITLSEFIYHELIENLEISPERITAIPLAPSSIFYKRSDAEIDRYLNKHSIGHPYFLSVAANEPRKNLNGLVRALEGAGQNYMLVLAGPGGWLNNDFETTIRQSKQGDRIIRLGHVSDDQLALLYSGASALVYPSYYEGFGLPILEAMACGCPVVCSNCGAMAEVAGDAAILVDPNHPEAVSAAMDQIIEDSELRTRLITMGYRRIQDFSWERTATETIAVFERVRSIAV